MANYILISPHKGEVFFNNVVMGDKICKTVALNKEFYEINQVKFLQCFTPNILRIQGIFWLHLHNMNMYA